MNCKFFEKRRVTFILIVLQLFTGCDVRTEERIDKTSKTFPNGKHIIVEKSNKVSTSVGIFTSINYGTSHSFIYEFTIIEDDIKWEGGSGEPKNIIFCKEAVYLRYLKEKPIKAISADTINNRSIENHTYEIQEFFQRHIDRRYFFKIFGSEYWEDISSDDYNSIKKICEEYEVPNDGELLLEVGRNE